jgi:glutathione S-transferase
MPVLEEDGWVLWESNAILIYFATKKPEIGLWPSDPREQTDILRWMFWDASHWDVACDIIVTERLKKQLLITQESGRRTLGKAVTPQPIDPEHLAEGERYVRELAAVLDEHLRGRIWLVGDRVTVAYFALGAFMHLREPVGPLPLSEFHEIVRWYEGVRQLPAWEVALQSIARPA